MNSRWCNRTGCESIETPFDALIYTHECVLIYVYDVGLDLMGLHDVCFALAPGDSPT